MKLAESSITKIPADLSPGNTEVFIFAGIQINLDIATGDNSVTLKSARL